VGAELDDVLVLQAGQVLRLKKVEVHPLRLSDERGHVSRVARPEVELFRRNLSRRFTELKPQPRRCPSSGSRPLPTPGYTFQDCGFKID
jgi:hypothetical protein